MVDNLESPNEKGQHGDNASSRPVPSPSDKENSHTPHAEKCTEYKDKSNRQFAIIFNSGFWTAFATVVIALTTIVYTHYAAKQLDLTNRQLRATNEAFRLDERAWVEIEPIKPKLVVPASGKFGAAFRYDIYPKNVGKTVATDVQVRAFPETFGSIRMGDDARQVSFYQDKMLLTQMHGSNPDGSNAEIPISQPLEKVLSPGTVAAVPFTMNGQEPKIFPKDEWVAYLIGRIDYIDAFRIPHWRKFCFFVARPTGELWNCKQGNDEDRNQKLRPKNQIRTLPRGPFP